MTDELIGKRIGGYEILSVIGRGGMATVYRAHQVSMNRTVALKILPRHFLNHEDYLQRFHREVKIVSQLEHRNIVPVHDYGEHEAQPYIAMRYMHGGSVDDVLQKGALDLEQIISILEQIAPALDYAHAKTVLHRDLKPSNVLMDDDGGAYLTDFGIARILSESGGTITTHGVVGTPSYMSPEQAQGQPLDSRSDVYALGVMLFEMVTGRRPFESDTPYGIAVLQVTTPPPPMRTFKPDVPASVESVILNALRKHREERYASAAALLDAFRRAVREPAVSMSDTQPVVLGRDAEGARSDMFPAQNMPRPDFTQPAPPVQVEYQTPPQVIYSPPPPSSHYTSSVQSIPAVPRVRRKERGGNWWVSLLIGSVIGCGLLALVVMVAALLAENSRQEEQRLLQTATADAASTLTATFAPPIGGNPVSTADSTESVSPDAPTVQPSDLPGAAMPTNTPRAPALPVNTAPPSIPVETAFTGVAPIGVRPTPTPVPITAQGSILFFAERAGNYDVYRLALPSLTETRLTNYGLADTYPMMSPDGQWIIFQSDRDGDFDVMVMESDGENIRRLVPNRIEDRIPSWSADGEWVLFSSDTRGDGNFDLFRVRADGSDLQMLFSNGQRNSHARWSPDGRYVVFTTGDADDANTWEIARYDMQTGEVVYLTENNVRDSSPTFNPDGTRILYLTQGQGFGAIAEMDAASGRQRIVYDGAGYESSATYSTDGQYIVFTSDASGHDELYLMEADGTNVQQLTTRGGHYGTWIDS